ncbi:hypothetical protein NXW11_24420 [Bacteroides thetaiotaomicron]|nr:hypothetical protein [Bacteroides thetaiotaomicron]MCS2621039.1 hypothetical protein [Bacteroides thetaiotaomicron]
MPPRVYEFGVGGFCPSLKLVDTYPMAKPEDILLPDMIITGIL